MGTISEIGVEQTAAAIEGKKGLSGGQCGWEECDRKMQTCIRGQRRPLGTLSKKVSNIQNTEEGGLTGEAQVLTNSWKSSRIREGNMRKDETALDLFLCSSGDWVQSLLLAEQAFTSSAAR